MSVYTFLAAIVISQLSFHQELWRAVSVEGVMVWKLEGSGSIIVELMPIRYKRDLVRAFVRDLGLDREAFFRRVHGSRFQDLLDDKGYFFTAMEGTSIRNDGPGKQRDQRVGVGTPFHYRVDRGKQVAALGQRTISVGPYTITEYLPRIDYTAWRCTHDTRLKRSTGAPVGTEEWQDLELPTAREPDLSVYSAPAFRVWGSLPVYCHGALTRESQDLVRVHLTVSLRAPEPGDQGVAAFYVNGKEVPARRAVRHASMGAHSEDVLFDLSDVLLLRRNDVAFRIEGRGLQFDLDVYESGE